MFPLNDSTQSLQTWKNWSYNKRWSNCLSQRRLWHRYFGTVLSSGANNVVEWIVIHLKNISSVLITVYRPQKCDWYNFKSNRDQIKKGIDNLGHQSQLLSSVETLTCALLIGKIWQWPVAHSAQKVKQKYSLTLIISICCNNLFWNPLRLITV